MRQSKLCPTTTSHDISITINVIPNEVTPALHACAVGILFMKLRFLVAALLEMTMGLSEQALPYAIPNSFSIPFLPTTLLLAHLFKMLL